MKHHALSLRILFVVFALLMFGATAFAQETTGSIDGIVTDANGALVNGATVTITDVEKKVEARVFTTDDSGKYSAPNLQPSMYDLTVEAPRFKKHVRTRLKLDVGQHLTLDVQLEAGDISEVVTVEANPVAVELATPTVSNVINGDQAKELSLNNRNWVQLVTLAPGVSNDLNDQVYVGTTNPDTGTVVTQSIAVNGARSSQNTFTVDGADITDRGSNITIQAYPSVDSIGEFRVLQSLFPAESGRSGGGQVNIVTRSGGKDFHGSIFEFIRNEAFNANNFFINSTVNPTFGRDSNGKAKRQPFRYNNWGWTLGGPVYLPLFGEGGSAIKRLERTFFFYSEEFRKDRRFLLPTTVTVPDANLRNGIFPFPVCINRAYLGETCTGAFILPAGTPIPAAFRSPAAAAYVAGVYSKLPLPNAGTTAAPYNLVSVLPNVADYRSEIIKIDHSFTDNWSGYYRYQHDNIPTIDGNSLFSSGTSLPDVSTTSTNSPGKTHTAQTTYVINPKTILEARYTYGYGAILSNNVGLLALSRTSVPITLPFENTRDRIPSVSVNGFTGLGSFGPYDNFSYKHNIGGGLTRIFGNHTTKWGAVYSLYRKNENALAGFNEGNFNSFPSAVAPGTANTTLNQNRQRWASFLVGNVAASGFAQAHFDYTADLRTKTFEAYGQDEWRMRKNMTMYYGVRYSYFPGPYDKNGRLSNFDPTLFNPADAPQVTGAGVRVVAAGVPQGNYCNGIIVNSQNFTTGPSQFNCRPTVSPWGKYVVDVSKTDFAPRFGVAWDPFGKGTTSVRLGYGIYHEQVLNGFYLTQIGTNPPYQETITNASGATSLDNPAAGFSVPTGLQALRGAQTDWKTPYMQHWSLNVQHQLQRKFVVSVGYYGSKGTHLIGLTEINDLPPGKALTSLCAVNTAYYAQTPAPTLVQCQPNGYVFHNTATTGATTGNPNGTANDILILDQIRPFKGFRSIALVQPRYNSNYHSLQVAAERRFSGASQMKLAYTWSRNMTDNPSDRSNSPQNPYNIGAEYQRASLDRRHILTFNYVYELPFFKHQRGFSGRLLGGWQASGIATYNSGLPFTATTSNLDPAGLALINANPTARPNLLCDPNANAPHAVQWIQPVFNPGTTVFNSNSCFSANPTAFTGLPNTVGNAARGVILGPPTHRVDFTMAKNIRLGETARVQFRGEVYNIFNHTNFRNFVSLNVTSTSFGQISSTRDPRTMQFAVKLSF